MKRFFDHLDFVTPFMAALSVGLLGIVTTTGACVPPPTEPGDIVITNNNTNNNGQPGGGASPSPSPGAGTVIARVGVGQFGERCPAGVSPSGDGRSSTVRVNCTAFITCSAYSPSGQEHFDLAVIGPAPEEFRATAGEGAIVQTQAASNPYNLDILGKAVGTASYTCRVKGVTSPTYSLRVVP